MKTFYVADGKAFRNARFGSPRMSVEDRNYLRKTTKYIDKVWTFFSSWEDDFRLLVNY